MTKVKELEDVFLEKRRPKGEIKFNITLNEEQKNGKAITIDSEIVIITGIPGSGKTLMVAQTALDLLFKRDLEKVYITRPTQQVGSSLGYLPGELQQKLNPYLDPFKDNLYSCYDKKKVDDMLKEDTIEGTAIQYIRGKTYGKGKMLIVDEAQNTTKAEMLAIITRLGKGGKIVIVGDVSQKDTNILLDGLSYVIDMSKKIDGIKHIKLKENHRSNLVGEILDFEYGKN
jgi:phosphate starvation-inducible protein PhoH and related proteins